MNQASRSLCGIVLLAADWLHLLFVVVAGTVALAHEMLQYKPNRFFSGIIVYVCFTNGRSSTK